MDLALVMAVLLLKKKKKKKTLGGNQELKANPRARTY